MSISDLGDAVLYVVQPVIVYVVVDMIAGGAVEDAPITVVTPIVGSGTAFLLGVLIALVGIGELVAFAFAMSGEIRNAI